MKKIIDKVKTWEIEYFNTKTSSIDDIWIHMTTREFGLNYKCKLSFQYESKEFLVVINEQTNDKLRRTLKSLKEKTVNIRRDHDFDEKGTFLNPMIVWLSKNTDDSLDNVYQLIKTIYSMISTNFFVFLFIEKYDSVENKDLSEKYENSLKNLFSSIETIDSKIWNTIATVFIEGNGIGLNVRKSYEIYWSKFFEIDLFYSVNEKIDKFFEYDHTLEDFMANEETAVRALDFMARVFFQGLFDTGQSISDTDMDLHIKYLLTSLYREKVIDSEKYNYLNDLCSNYTKNKDNRERMVILEAIKGLKSNSKLFQDDFVKAIDILSGSKSQFLTGIFLAKKTSIVQKPAQMNQLNINSLHHFTQSKPNDYDVILYNTNALEKIYPIKEQTHNVNYVFKEDDYFYYNILKKSASCYVVCSFTYEAGFLNQSK